MRELDVLIAAHVCGWEWLVDGNNKRYLLPPTEFGVKAEGTEAIAELGYETIPHFSADLNACFEAQAKCIEKVGLDTYRDALLAGLGVVGEWAEDAINAVVTATAEQRCLAMLKALGVEAQP